jgi:sensor c-di-GMP phosphodiesterase-like protein
VHRILSTSLLLIVGILAIAAPIVASVYLSDQQSLDVEKAGAQALADEVLRRADKTSQQMEFALNALRDTNKGDPCSEERISAMRQLALGASNLKAVGYVSDKRLICSSLGHHGHGLSLGSDGYTSSRGVLIRPAVALPIAPEMHFVVAERDGYAAVLHRDNPFDIFVNERDISLNIVGYSSGRLILKRGEFKTSWLRKIPKGGAISFFDGQHVVAQRRSNEFDVIALAAVPVKYVRIRSKDLSVVLLPVGVLAAFVLATALYFLARQYVSLPSILQQALKRDEFFLLYQPVVDLQTGRCIGAETLIRWKRANGDVVNPDLFIPIAEENNLIKRITAHLLGLIERDVPNLIKNHPDMHVGINLSAADLQSDAIVSCLREFLRRTGMKPHNLMVEATERGFINTGLSHAVARDLRALGISVAIDDFGTGYSSLSYLTTFKVDFLKIDKSFVDTIGTEAATSTVILHIIEMAKSLDIKMIAEGVETEEQAQFLRDRGVQYGQGWLFGKAMPIEELTQLLKNE